MCGPTGEESSIERQQSTFMSELQANYNENFSEQQSVLNHLNSVLQPIVSAGPGQQGMTAQEKSALTTEAIDTTGANYASAARALNNELAGRAGGGNLPESGVDEQLAEGLAAQSAGQLSSEELGITNEDYQLGRQQFNEAVGGEESLAGMENPNATAGQATSAGNAAFTSADQIAQQQSQEESDIAGGITGLALSGATMGLKAASVGGFA